jgi:hypothetical protein
MGITVKHDVDASAVGAISQDYGSFQTEERRSERAQDKSFELAKIEKQADINAQVQDRQHQNQLETLDRQFQLEEVSRDAQSQRELEKQKDLYDYEYTSKQQMEIENIQNQIQDVELRTDLPDDEKSYVKQQLEANLWKIKPFPRPRNSKYPKGQDVGDIWEDPKIPGVVLTRNESGMMEKFTDKKESNGLFNMSAEDFYKSFSQLQKSMTVKSTSKGDIVPNADTVISEMIKIESAKQNFSKVQEVSKLPPRYKYAYDNLIRTGRSHEEAMKAIRTQLGSEK